MVLELLRDMLLNDCLIAAEQKAAVAIIKQLETAEIDDQKEQLRLLLNPTLVANRVDAFSIDAYCFFSGFECYVRPDRRLGSR